MSAPDQSEPQNDLNAVFEKIQEIAIKSASGDYIYRGEPQHYDKVSSTLYRQYEEDIEAEHFEIEVAQGEMSKEAKDYIHETDEEFEVLTQLQHFGGKTNLIDFTNDYLIALFFACDSFFDEPGRVILLGEEAQRENRVEKPRNVINRVRDQKSIFARPPKGFIEVESDDAINIPKWLKQSMLRHLEKYHDISAKTIYNDLHGFIRIQDLHQSAYTEFFKGLTCQNRNQHDRAIEYYTEAIYLKPDYAEAYYNRGRVYHNKGDFDCAIEDYNTAIGLKPDYVYAYTNRGNAYSDKGDYVRAIEDYNTAINLSPDYAEAYNNRGMAYQSKDDYVRAIEDYNTAMQLKPDLVEAYCNRGNAYSNKGDYDRAIEDFNEALVLKPDYVEAYNNRGNAHSDKGDYDHAIEDYTRAIELNPNYAMAYSNRGLTYKDKGNYDHAIVDLNKVLELNPNYANAYYNRGMAWLHLGEWGKAKSDLSTARDMGVDIITSFHNDYTGVPYFEQRNGVKLPADLAAMLL